jgi:caffeoyl-CoA O-methyltransferase
MKKGFSLTNPELEKYVEETFQPQDAVLSEIRQRAAAAGLPDIHVGSMDGLHLEVLARAVGAQKIVEIGTLAGFSGLCLARALPPEGRLYTFEFDPKHAEVARESFRRGGVSEKVEILVGPALERLPEVETKGPFDLVFIDADKGSYPAYLEWAVRNVRRGGVILADNTLAGGEITDLGAAARGTRVKALREYNERAAKHPELRTTLLPTSDGLSFSVKL